MRRVLLCIGFVLALAASLIADSNLRITDVGLHGYSGATSSVRLIVHNPSPEAQTMHLQIAATDHKNFITNTVTADISLNGGEQRELELPVLMPGGNGVITADAAAAGVVFGHDKQEAPLRQANLIVLMCASDSTCKTAQSQIQFSGTIEERADKNRQAKFEIVNDPRDHWWAYSACRAIVLARPTAEFTQAQRDALEGFLRSGGRLVLLEDEIADPGFLSAYRQGPASSKGERVGKGTLNRVSGLNADQLGNTFVGQNLRSVLDQTFMPWNSNQTNWMSRRFATAFDFPRLGWLLIWLTVYVVMIGVLNFAVLRRLRRLDLGWISMCGLALLFAAGFYFSSASRRPRNFRLDNLATYYLDSRSPLAVADYNLRVSAPDRRDVLVSIADPAVFTSSNFAEGEANSEIWTEMNRQGIQEHRTYEIHLGPPSQVELPMLKWSFHDLNLQGLHEFSGTVHFVGPNRLRNDTGQRFEDAVYLDYPANALYALPALGPGEEIQLNTIAPKRIRPENGKPQEGILPSYDPSKQTLQDAALTGGLPLVGWGRVFAGLSDVPALPVELNVTHQRSVHALIVVALEQP